MRLTATLLVGGLVAASMVSAPFVSNAQITKQGSKYLLRTKWTKGKVYKYGLTVAFEGGGQKQNMTSDITMTVKSVSGKNGTVEVKSSGMGQQGPATQTVTFDDRGKVLNGNNMMGATADLPANPVAIGDSWTNTLAASNQTMGMKGTSKAKLVGVKSVGGRQCAVLAMTVSLSGGQQGMSGSGTGESLVDMADGQAVKTSMKMLVTMKPQGQAGAKPVTLKTAFTLSRK